MKKLGFGFMRLPLLDLDDQRSIDMAQVCQMVDTFLKNGFTYFDTAYMYHGFKSELALREALVKRYPRECFTVATKLPTMLLKTPDDPERIFQEQLEKCGVEYFDYYMLHNLCVNHYAIAKKFNCFSFLQEKKSKGKIKYIGFSYHDTAELLDEILTAHPEVDFVQLQLNYLDWDNESIQSRKCHEIAVKHGKPVIVMEPVKGGTLANMPGSAEKLFKRYYPELSISSLAIRFAASHENVMMVLSGMSTIDQVVDNTGYMQNFKPLTDDEHDLVDQVVKIFNESIVVPCTACSYCVADCPQNIPIPKYFALYNAEMQALNRDFSLQYEYYLNYAKTYGKASDCKECGRCEELCPQHIEIRKYLKEVAATFDKGNGDE